MNELLSSYVEVSPSVNELTIINKDSIQMDVALYNNTPLVDIYRPLWETKVDPVDTNILLNKSKLYHSSRIYFIPEQDLFIEYYPYDDMYKLIEYQFRFILISNKYVYIDQKITSYNLADDTETISGNEASKRLENKRKELLKKRAGRYIEILR